MEVTENQNSLLIENTLSKNVSAKISAINSIGLVTIRFNSTMMTDINMTHINKTVIDMYITPAADRENEEDFRLSDLNFTWELVSFKN